MNLLLDFTHTYSPDWISENKDLIHIDCTDIVGTDKYCMPEAEDELMQRISRYPLKGIHFIDSGNYHYMTRIFTKRIDRPYNLVFFDNHNDCQPTMISELLSCGAWAKEAAESDDNLQKLVIIGPSEDTINDIDVIKKEKLVCISWEEFSVYQNFKDLAGSLAEKADLRLPVYISVDKDVLSEEYARTNWNQGQMKLEELKGFLTCFFAACKEYNSEILGVDICGELPERDAGFMEALKAEKINRRTNNELYGFFKEVLR